MAVEFVAPQKVYQQGRMSAAERMGIAGYSLPQPMGLTTTKTGGMATIIPGHPYPRKGFIYTGLTLPNNQAKRITLALFSPFASLRHGIKEFLNSYFYNYIRLIDSIYSSIDQTPYLHYKYYSEFGKSLWNFIYLFLKRLGVKDEIAYRTGLQLMTQIEYDDAYKVRIQDILHEANKGNLLKNPRKELLRLLEIYIKREPFLYGEKDLSHVGARMVNIIKMLSFLLYIPWIKNAFIFAVENTNFEWFKLDEWDYYWCLNRFDYKCMGRDFEDRHKEMIGKMVDFAQKTNPDKEIRVEEENGQILIKIYDIIRHNN